MGTCGRSWLLVLLAAAETASASLPETLSARRDFWKRRAFYCNNEFPAKRLEGRPLECDDGDMTLFNGLLCASGIAEGCRGVADARGADGRWFRSPLRRRRPWLNGVASFSRDMAMGVMLYLVESRDVDAARSWMGWIRSNSACLLRNPLGGACLFRGGRICPEDHDSCRLSPHLWYLLGLVWQELGLPRDDRMRDELALASHRVFVDEVRLTPPGYALHLQAVKGLLLEKLGKHLTQRRALLQVLMDKQPDNLFFRRLFFGPVPSLYGDLLDQCPAPGRFSGDLRQWAWERDTRSRAWRRSMLWDCLFLLGMMNRDGLPPGRLVVLETRRGGRVRTGPPGRLLHAPLAAGGQRHVFGLTDLNGGTLEDGDQVHLNSRAGWFLSAPAGGGPVVADRRRPGPWETFTVVRLAAPGGIRSGDGIALRSSARLYLSVDGYGGLLHDGRSSIGSGESFRLHFLW